MCHSDISTLVFQWSETAQAVKEWGQIPHVWRDFEKIQEWGRKNQLSEWIDVSIHIEDDLVIPELSISDP